MTPIIKTTSLTKQYQGKPVVAELDLFVPAGCIYGFLGPNGAGKSTTMKMILGLIKPTAGHVTVFGKTVNQKNRLDILRNTGSLIESPAYYGHLSGRENLSLVASLKQVALSQIDEVLRIVHLEHEDRKKVNQYSLGMKQRLGLAAALLGYPKVLLLDEPTNGLDPAGIQEMRELISSLPKRCGMTVLVSSHLLSEIDLMATHVGIINSGSLIFQDKLSVLHEHSHPQMRLLTTDNEAALRLLKQSGLPASFTNNAIRLNTAKTEDILRAGQLLFQSDIGLLRLEEEQKSLEDIFLGLIGRSAQTYEP